MPEPSKHDNTWLQVEVVYALPNEQQIFKTQVVETSEQPDVLVEDVIKQSGVLDAYPDIDLAVNKVGIFGRTVPLNTAVNDGDRIEIYRPLLADPKEIRRRRAEKQAKN